MVKIIKTATLALATAVAAIAGVVAPAAAQPSKIAPRYAIASQTKIQGRIASIPDKYTIIVRDDQGYEDNVSLHQGTVINPTGITLQTGFPVTIYGQPKGSTFAANEIDTPYRYVPVAYGASPYWGPYPPYWGLYPYYGPPIGFVYVRRGPYRI